MTIIRSGYSGGSGNSVADYHWRVEICDTCNGQGEVSATIEEIKDYIINLFYGKKKIFKEAIRLWHELKESEVLTCRECEGKGKWEVWY